MRIWDAGASASIEVTPSDELIPYIDEVKAFSMEHFGAFPHLTIARDDRTKSIDYLTNLSPKEYDLTWSSFDSDFWRFKRSIFGIKQKGFCYAGAWSYYVDMVTGSAKSCYFGNYFFNFYEKVNGEYPSPSEHTVGRCPLPHCYNGHALLTLGLIPGLYQTRYGRIRDRKKTDGTHWLQPELSLFFDTKLEESNGVCSRLRIRSIYAAKRIRNVLDKSLGKWL